jgi:hypothetical protein
MTWPLPPFFLFCNSAASFPKQRYSFHGNSPDLDTGFLQDREAMKSDWRCIGGDMRRVMNSMTNAR